MKYMGVASGCGCKEVYRFPHTTYPYILLLYISVLFCSSIPVAEQSLTVEDGPLSPPGIRQQSSVAEHFLAVEDGFVSLPSILSQSSVHEQF